MVAIFMVAFFEFRNHFLDPVSEHEYQSHCRNYHPYRDNNDVVASKPINVGRSKSPLGKLSTSRLPIACPTTTSHGLLLSQIAQIICLMDFIFSCLSRSADSISSLMISMSLCCSFFSIQILAAPLNSSQVLPIKPRHWSVSSKFSAA